MIYLFVFAHLVADFILQPYALVKRKRYWDGLLVHGGIVLACMLLLPLVDRAAAGFWPQMLAITAVHIVADRWKVHRGDQLFSHPIGPFLLDQAVHIGTIMLVLGLTLPADQVWMVTGSPFAMPAVYGSVYVAAAFAAPIAVMIWLDPSFLQVELAGAARLRSLAVGAGAVTLMLLGGPLALPATLIVLAWFVRRPPSSHPLDTPQGLLAVLCAATLLTTALMVMAHH